MYEMACFSSPTHALRKSQQRGCVFEWVPATLVSHAVLGAPASIRLPLPPSEAEKRVPVLANQQESFPSPPICLKSAEFGVATATATRPIFRRILSPALAPSEKTSSNSSHNFSSRIGSPLLLRRTMAALQVTRFRRFGSDLGTSRSSQSSAPERTVASLEAWPFRRPPCNSLTRGSAPKQLKRAILRLSTTSAAAIAPRAVTPLTRKSTLTPPGRSAKQVRSLSPPLSPPSEFASRIQASCSTLLAAVIKYPRSLLQHQYPRRSSLPIEAQHQLAAEVISDEIQCVRFLARRFCRRFVGSGSKRVKAEVLPRATCDILQSFDIEAQYDSTPPSQIVWGCAEEIAEFVKRERRSLCSRSAVGKLPALARLSQQSFPCPKLLAFYLPSGRRSCLEMTTPLQADPILVSELLSGPDLDVALKVSRGLNLFDLGPEDTDVFCSSWMAPGSSLPRYEPRKSRSPALTIAALWRRIQWCLVCMYRVHQLHHLGVRHNDFKACNFAIRVTASTKETQSPSPCTKNTRLSTSKLISLPEFESTVSHGVTPMNRSQPAKITTSRIPKRPSVRQPFLQAGVIRDKDSCSARTPVAPPLAFPLAGSVVPSSPTMIPGRGGSPPRRIRTAGLEPQSKPGAQECRGSREGRDAYKIGSDIPAPRDPTHLRRKTTITDFLQGFKEPDHQTAEVEIDLRVIDLDCATPARSPFYTGGTTPYLSPEQLISRFRQNLRSRWRNPDLSASPMAPRDDAVPMGDKRGDGVHGAITPSTTDTLFPWGGDGDGGKGAPSSTPTAVACVARQRGKGLGGSPRSSRDAVIGSKEKREDILLEWLDRVVYHDLPPPIDERSDLWALGLTLMEILSGRTIYEEADTLHASKKVTDTSCQDGDPRAFVYLPYICDYTDAVERSAHWGKKPGQWAKEVRAAFITETSSSHTATSAAEIARVFANKAAGLLFDLYVREDPWDRATIPQGMLALCDLAAELKALLRSRPHK